MTRRRLALLAAIAVVLPAAAQDADEAAEKAVRTAAGRAAPSVVMIHTAGGLDAVAGGKDPKGKTIFIGRGTGATTGVVVGADGYVVTSSFNFANKPTDIFVTVPGKEREVATVVGTDFSRMLTLLKIKSTGLPVPAAVPKAEVKIGQTALALGRALDPTPTSAPSVSVGVVSAKNRLYGRAIQSDAKFSPANYGGPLVALDGRVLGVIVPASPQGEGETAGFEWYDSGIGFVIPFEDVLAKLPALKEKKELRRGLLGFNPDPKTGTYAEPPVVAAVQPDSAAARAGLQVGDTIVKADGRPVPHFSALQHLLGPKYEGDAVKLTVKRGDKEIELPPATLLGSSPAYVNAFLGILPIRSATVAGVGVRYVYPNSAAAAAGMKAGDRILFASRDKAQVPVKDRASLATFLSQMAPGTEVGIDVIRKEGSKTVTLKAKLTPVPDFIPEKVPLVGAAPAARANEAFVAAFQDDPFAPKKKDAKKADTGLLERTDAVTGRKHWVYVPDNYDPAVPHGLLVWLHPAGAGGPRDAETMIKSFRPFCESSRTILLGPKAEAAEGWTPSESETVLADVNRVMSEYAIDKARVVAHGLGRGGQMAYYLGFQARDVFRGVAPVGATLGNPPRDNVATQPLSFFVAAGGRDPELKEIEAGKAQLDEKRFPISYRLMKDAGKEYLDGPTFAEFLAWLDAIDRL
ncbi:PDZ domain-containing protein [Urbifossiella limnaea]|uniref:Putative periplasmic serine endoprotease DegP-like n=1 Tax=Urbifossiella limnaea TaxID=2528023 RepID=A0A517XXR1_9BACT|nr:PDZ domain-containing protein [Urbifossiella limnaea]QDU22318.1 putative periplasmic serine endoprotease DegP-like precursor [Urbifossiella limnaea]